MLSASAAPLRSGRPKPRYWLSRLILAAEILVCIVLVSLFEPASMTAQAIEATGRHGWLVMSLLCVSNLVCMADVLLNDLPARPWVPSLIELRWVGFGAMSLALGVLGFLVAAVHGLTWLLVAYWLNAIFAAAMTHLDQFARWRP